MFKAMMKSRIKSLNTHPIRLSKDDEIIPQAPSEKRRESCSNDLTHDDFQCRALIASGTWSEVYLVEKITGEDAGAMLAMKVMLKSQFLDPVRSAIPFNELETLKLMSGKPYHSKLHSAFTTKKNLYIVTEFVQGGDLFSQYALKESFTEDEARFYITQVVLAIDLLHRQNIVYRDVKLENILLDADGNIVLCDYGSSKALKTFTRTKSVSGTAEMMAPEVAAIAAKRTTKPYGLSADWWSVGILLLELLSGVSPFSSNNDCECKTLTVNKIVDKEIELPESLSDDAKDLIRQLLQKNPEQRLGFFNDADDVKSHRFFDGVDWMKAAMKLLPPPMVPIFKDKYDIRYFKNVDLSVSVKTPGKDDHSFSHGFSANVQDNSDQQISINDTLDTTSQQPLLKSVENSDSMERKLSKPVEIAEKILKIVVKQEPLEDDNQMELVVVDEQVVEKNFGEKLASQDDRSSNSQDKISKKPSSKPPRKSLYQTIKRKFGKSHEILEKVVKEEPMEVDENLSPVRVVSVARVTRSSQRQLEGRTAVQASSATKTLTLMLTKKTDFSGKFIKKEPVNDENIDPTEPDIQDYPHSQKRVKKEPAVERSVGPSKSVLIPAMKRMLGIRKASEANLQNISKKESLNGKNFAQKKGETLNDENLKPWNRDPDWFLRILRSQKRKLKEPAEKYSHQKKMKII